MTIDNVNQFLFRSPFNGLMRYDKEGFHVFREVVSLLYTFLLTCMVEHRQAGGSRSEGDCITGKSIFLFDMTLLGRFPTSVGLMDKLILSYTVKGIYTFRCNLSAIDVVREEKDILEGFFMPIDHTGLTKLLIGTVENQVYKRRKSHWETVNRISMDYVSRLR